MDNPVIYYYRIAGITYRISLPRKYAYSHHAMLAAYQTAPCEADRFLDLSVADTLSVPDTKPIYTDGQRSVYPNGSDYVIFDGGNPPYLRIDQQGNHTHATILRSNIPYGITVSLVMWVMTLPRDLIHRGGFLLHASYIDWNGKAILFTAPSGTGKSTQADLWGKYRGSRLLNGDRTAVMVTEQGVFAHGVPFCGSSGVNENVTLPIAAIVALSQAPTTTICRIRGLQAFRLIWEGCTVNHWDRQDMSACMDRVSNVVQRIPVYHLACTPDESAVSTLENEILNLR